MLALLSSLLDQLNSDERGRGGTLMGGGLGTVLLIVLIVVLVIIIL